MKQILLLLVFIMASFSSTQAQEDYRPMVVEGRQWVYENCSYGLSGDTLINGSKYIKMYRCEVPSEAVSYEGAWGEEDRKVYHVAAGETSPVLMYDFSNYVKGASFMGKKLDFLDTVLVNSKKVARFHWNGSEASDAEQKYIWADVFGGEQGILHAVPISGQDPDGQFYWCNDQGYFSPVFRKTDFYTLPYIEEYVRNANEIPKPELQDVKSFVTEFAADKDFCLLNVLSGGLVRNGEAWNLQACADPKNVTVENGYVYQFKTTPLLGTGLHDGEYYLWSDNAPNTGCIIRDNSDARTGGTNTCFVNGSETRLQEQRYNWTVELKNPETKTYLLKVPMESGDYLEGCVLGVDPSHYSYYTVNFCKDGTPTYALYWDVPTESVGAEWQFVDVTAYRLYKNKYNTLLYPLYDILWRATSYGLNVEEEMDIYLDKNSTDEQLQDAITSVSQRIETTSIKNVESKTTYVGRAIDSLSIYDLQGRKVGNRSEVIGNRSEFRIQNSELKRGIYIINGKKVVVK